MAVDATTSTGAYAGSMKAAARVPTATPNPAASTPRRAKSHVGLDVRCSLTTVTLTRSRYVASASSASGRPEDQRSNSTYSAIVGVPVHELVVVPTRNFVALGMVMSTLLSCSPSS